MPVRDQDLAGSQKVAVGGRHEIELGVVIIAPAVRPEDLEALLDREIRAADEHGVGEAVIARHTGAVAKGPGDDIAITTVLPLPVAILQANRVRGSTDPSTIVERRSKSASANSGFQRGLPRGRPVGSRGSR